jgi:hypothetical protein
MDQQRDAHTQAMAGSNAAPRGPVATKAKGRAAAHTAPPAAPKKPSNVELF